MAIGASNLTHIAVMVTAQHQAENSYMDFNHNGKDDIQEIKDGWAAFVTDVKSGNINAIAQDVNDGAAWLKGEIDGLIEEAQTFFNWGLSKVREESTSLGEAVANMLTLLANGSLQQALGLGQNAISQLAAISSQIVTAAVGLLGGFKAATA